MSISHRARMLKRRQPSYDHLQAARHRGSEQTPDIKPDVSLHCGWGRLLFGHTFQSEEAMAAALLTETRGDRDIAFYVARPHVVVSQDPQRLFLDPSDSFRLWLNEYQSKRDPVKGIRVRRLRTEEDLQRVNAIYQRCRMQCLDPEVVMPLRHSREQIYLLAEDMRDGRVLGAILGINHGLAFNDPESGSSLWSLAVDPDCPLPQVGEALVRHLAEKLLTLRCTYLDLSVLHTNTAAITLYERLGFRQIQTFAVKKRNAINQALYTDTTALESLNPYARIIVDEALRRGIHVDVEDAEHNIFVLSWGGRHIRCHESLSDLTPATAMTLCQNKWLTQRCLNRAGIRTPQGRLLEWEESTDGLFEHLGERLVVKPHNGEQGKGIAVDIRTPESLEAAVAEARRYSSQVLVEPFCSGHDLRILVINDEVVAAAIRKPATVIGTGQHDINTLIDRTSRRRAAMTGGESRIPRDSETQRCVEEAGYALTDILPEGQALAVRKTANLHTGGVLEDVTDILHPTLRDAALEAARALQIPVTGIDMLVPDAAEPDYVLIEANERPGLANHEPHPTAERFIDMLFPTTRQG
ncbi:N-acetylglutaminylglutamine synthetase [Pokkaliibacter sp. CJK22405]|uniref:N-acetylglutaminylglutamine synthetase n=1 Tax=Pokkaliibacter sp. CJK22405 TaxID=3384615 RepID=UPI00398518AB